MSYRDQIKKHTSSLSPAIPAHHIEAWMRSERPTLDGLSPKAFKRLALDSHAQAAAAGSDLSERLADSYGLRAL